MAVYLDASLLAKAYVTGGIHQSAPDSQRTYKHHIDTRTVAAGGTGNATAADTVTLLVVGSPYRVIRSCINVTTVSTTATGTFTPVVGGTAISLTALGATKSTADLMFAAGNVVGTFNTANSTGGIFDVYTSIEAYL